MGLAVVRALEETDRVASVHMHFPSSGKYIEIERASLSEGDLTIAVKKPVSKLRVRVHPWADAGSISVRSSGEDVAFELDGDYLSIADPSGVVEVKYPGVSRRVEEPWPGGKLVSVWKGNRVETLESDHPVTIPLFPVNGC